MKLSIIIPVYNTEAYLPRCLSSCLEQDIPSEEYEIVIVNDGSTDGSPEIAREAASSRTNVRLISRENGGLSRARNTGLAAAKGEYVWFVDSDDYIARNCLGTLLGPCTEEALDLLGISRTRVLLDRSVVERPFYDGKYCGRVYSGPSAMRQGLMKTPCAPFYLFRRAFLTENGLSFLEGVLHEDEEFTPRAFYQAQRVSFSDRFCYFACAREDSIMQTPRPKRAYDLLRIAGNLDRFSREIPASDRYLFSRRIARVVDSILKLCLRFPKDTSVEVTRKVSGDKTLIRHLIGSRILKFQCLGILIRLFPRRYFPLYRRAVYRMGSGRRNQLPNV